MNFHENRLIGPLTYILFVWQLIVFYRELIKFAVPEIIEAT
jgi:hypothetical protein